MARLFSAALLASCVLLAACKSEAPATSSAPAVTEADAAKAFDATVAAWGSMDAAKVKGLYAPDVAGFDYAMPGLVSDRATWDKNQDGFAAAKLDKITVSEKKVQLLGNDAFVVTSASEGNSTAIPANKTQFRCTDIYQRQPDGKWLIVNENCGASPKPA